MFVPLNRGKRSIAVDLTKPAGRDVVLRLARSADVFFEKLAWRKMAALGLDEAAVRRRTSRSSMRPCRLMGPRSRLLEAGL